MGTIDSGCHKNQKLDIVSAFEAWGKVSGKIDNLEYKQIIKKSSRDLAHVEVCIHINGICN